jgi:hypothetical protein
MKPKKVASVHDWFTFARLQNEFGRRRSSKTSAYAKAKAEEGPKKRVRREPAGALQAFQVFGK